MTDSYRSFLTAVIAALKASAPLTSLVGTRIYSDVPDNETFPYLVVRVDSADYSTKTTPAMEHTLQISAFTRDPSPDKASDIRQKVYNILNRGESALSSASVSNIMFNGISTIFKEPDGKTWQAIIQFRAVML